MDPIEIRKKVLEQLPTAETEADLLRLVQRTDESAKPAEFNFPAEVLIFVDGIRQRVGGDSNRDKLLTDIENSAQQAMLQLAFFNQGIQPPSSVIMAVYNLGWRVGKFGGFERQPRPVAGQQSLL